MIHVENLNKRYGDRVLFEDVGWHVRKRDRIGLSGPNGAGKTTLLRMLAGLEEPDSGSIRMASDTTIGYLPQDGIVHHGRSVREELEQAFQDLLALKHEQHEIEDRLAHATEDGDHERLLERYAEVSERFRQLGGYEIDARVADVLKGLGFAPEDAARGTEEFSGGWQMRIALAKLLLARPNLLLMDEPTNHLDLPARNWLEEYLADYPGSVVLVSHDRYFLDAVVKRITEVGLRTLTDYHGNYSYYVEQHGARMEALRERARRQQEEIEKAEAFINRFRYQATKARQVQSRIKQLDKVERIEIPPERKRIRFKFPEAPRPGRVVLELKGVERAYGERLVLRRSDLIVERGDRIALVGPNGAGKSTLMRVLAGVDRPQAGVRVLGHKVVLDYFAQDQAAILDGGKTAYEEMSSVSPTTMVPMIRNILGGFLFSGDDVSKRVAVLSGGERNRLALAKMLLRPSNLLLLDEPTNHLDLDSKQVLLDALEDYGGTLLFVSHDRYFIDRLATKVIEIQQGELVVYPGGYEDFVDWTRRRAAGEALALPAARPAAHPPAASGTSAAASGTGATPTVASSPTGGRPTATQTPAQEARATPLAAAGRASGAAPQAPASSASKPAAGKKHAAAAPATPPADPLAPRLRPAGVSDRQGRQREERQRERETRKREARLAELEQRIATSERAVKELEAQMATPGFYDDRGRADEVVERHKTLMWEVGELMSQWEMLQAEVDAGASSPSQAR